MYPELKKEIATYERRTPKSAESYKRNLKRLSLGVASNYRAYDPYQIVVKEAHGSHFRDLDGNDYIDHNLCFGANWFGTVNRGVMPQPHWWDEQWTISVQHKEADIEKQLAAFEDVATALAKSQQQRILQPASS